MGDDDFQFIGTNETSEEEAISWLRSAGPERSEGTETLLVIEWDGVKLISHEIANVTDGKFTKVSWSPTREYSGPAHGDQI